MKPIIYQDWDGSYPAVVLGMPNSDYHAHPAISKSGLDLIHRSPAHYQYGAKREATRAMAIGSAIHCAILEPERFSVDYLLLREVKDRRSSEYKQACKVHDPEYVLTGEEADNVAGMQESVRSQYSMPVGETEVSVFAECPKTGVAVKCRFDLLTYTGHAVDLKKTQDSSREAFAKSVYNYRYHVQDAWYRFVYELATGKALESFTFLAVEEHPPHVAMPYELGGESLIIGHNEAMADLERYAECMEYNDWPGYERTDEPLELPAWALAQYENEIVEEIY